MRSVEPRQLVQYSMVAPHHCTSVDDLVLVQEIDCKQDLLDSFGGILLGELALLADTIEELTAGRELCDDIELVLRNKGG